MIQYLCVMDFNGSSNSTDDSGHARTPNRRPRNSRVTQEEVDAAIQSLRDSGEDVSIRSVRNRLGRGSMSTLGKMVNRYYADQGEGPSERTVQLLNQLRVSIAKDYQENCMLRQELEEEIKRLRDELRQVQAELKRQKEISMRIIDYAQSG